VIKNYACLRIKSKEEKIKLHNSAVFIVNTSKKRINKIRRIKKDKND